MKYTVDETPSFIMKISAPVFEPDKTPLTDHNLSVR